MFDDVLSLGYLIYQQGSADESGTSQTFPYIRIWFSSLERSLFFYADFQNKLKKLFYLTFNYCDKINFATQFNTRLSRWLLDRDTFLSFGKNVGSILSYLFG